MAQSESARKEYFKNSAIVASHQLCHSKSLDIFGTGLVDLEYTSHHD
jgi:hypothetical protein